MKRPLRRKRYDSKAWLFRKHHIDHKSLQEIANECNVTERTIRNKMEQFKINIVTW